MGVVCSVLLRCWNFEPVPKLDPSVPGREVPQRESPTLDFVDNPGGDRDIAPLLAAPGVKDEVDPQDERPLDEAAIQEMLNEVDELSD
jgi:hypothetical protein